ncbi:MAG: acyl-CoA dehydrogenase, partial [Perlucidibaca sp.]
IYEGTNGIQALDLVGRKLVRNKGAYAKSYLAEVRDLVAATSGDARLAAYAAATGKAVDSIESAIAFVIESAAGNADEVNAAAVDFLHAFGFLAYAHMWLLMAQAAVKGGDGFHADKLKVADFFFARLLPQLDSRIVALRAGSGSLMAMDAASF